MSERLDPTTLAAARLWGATRFPYLATGLFATRVVSVPGIGTIAVDNRWRLYVDPSLVRGWTIAALGGMLVHHTMHLLRDHAGRARSAGIGRESADDWIKAADAEINDDLAEAGVELPGRQITPASLGCEDGRLAEEYFAAIARRRPRGRCRDCGSGCHGHARPWEAEGGGDGVDPSGARLLRCQVAREVLDHCRGRLPGTVPFGLQRWAEELLEPKIDWRKALAAEIRHGIANIAGCVDYTYARPSRRACVSPDVVLPALRRPVPEVAIVVDTSGSVSDARLGRALAEVQGIMRGAGLGARRVAVLSCDTAVHLTQRVSASRQVRLAGGGGTDMGAGIDAAMRLRPRPSVVVVLTDGFTPWPGDGPKGARVVVGLIGDGDWPVPRWARLVRIEEVA
jgi:predicted metal-dependent peptidase